MSDTVSCECGFACYGQWQRLNNDYWCDEWHEGDEGGPDFVGWTMGDDPVAVETGLDMREPLWCPKCGQRLLPDGNPGPTREQRERGQRALAVQTEVLEWAAENFGEDRPSYQRILGAMEELGELAHAHLKQEQEIRTNEDHDANAKDAIGDVVIYLIDYCNTRGWDFLSLLLECWDAVKLRNWKGNKVCGLAPAQEATDAY